MYFDSDAGDAPFEKYLSLYEKNKDLIFLDAYAKDADPILDKAILSYKNKIKEFIAQVCM